MASANAIRITDDVGFRLDAAADAYEMALKGGLRVTLTAQDVHGKDGAAPAVTYTFKHTK